MERHVRTATVEMDSVGELIRKHLRLRGLTQSEFAKELDISVAYLSQLISGKRILSKKLIPVISQKIGIPQEQLKLLVSFESEKNPQIRKYLEAAYIEKYQPELLEKRGVEKFVSEDGREYDFATLPVLGYCEAGKEGLWDPDAYPKGVGMYRVPRPVDVDDPQAVAFEIKGDSMYPKFEEGDVVIVSPREPALSGDYVVVRLRSTGEIMAKRLRRERGMILLESVNPSVEPVITDESDLAICYKIVHVILNGRMRKV